MRPLREILIVTTPTDPVIAHITAIDVGHEDKRRLSDTASLHELLDVICEELGHKGWLATMLDAQYKFGQRHAKAKEREVVP